MWLNMIIKFVENNVPIRPQVGDLNRYIFYLTQNWNGFEGAIIQVRFEQGLTRILTRICVHSLSICLHSM